jgi:hypothetical protein
MTSIPCLPSPADAAAALRLVRALRLHETRRLKRMGPRADGGASSDGHSSLNQPKIQGFMGLMWDLYEFYGIDMRFV